MSKAIVGIVIGAVALSACTTLDPYTREEKTSHAGRGAVIGALGGAAIGALTNTSSGKQAAKNALIGAGVGALAGGGVGYYMDQQEAKLRQRLEGTGVGIQRVGDSIQLVMPSNVTFATDSSNIASNFYPVLNDVALVLDEYEKTYVQVAGHTDSDGAAEYNQDLSVRRANSVTSYLVNQSLMPERFIVRGFGETQPVASNQTPSGKAQNRRVEISIEPFVQN